VIERSTLPGVLLAVVTTALLLTVPGPQPGAAEPSDLIERLRICRSLTGDEARLRCFEDATSALDTESGAVAAQAPPSGLPADPEEAFGANQIPDFDRPRRDERLPELRTRIIGLTARATGEWVMTLENGQIWMQTQSEPYPLDLADGPVEVVLFRNVFGGFYMRKADENVRLRVKRIQ